MPNRKLNGLSGAIQAHFSACGQDAERAGAA